MAEADWAEGDGESGVAVITAAGGMQVLPDLPMPDPLSGAAVVVDADRTYLIGRSCPKPPARDQTCGRGGPVAFAWSAKYRRWSHLAPHPLGDLPLYPAGTVGGQPAFGTIDDGRPAIVRLSPGGGSWERLPAAPTTNATFMCAGTEGPLVLSATSRSAYTYRLIDDEWLASSLLTGPPMSPTSCEGGSIGFSAPKGFALFGIGGRATHVEQPSSMWAAVIATTGNDRVSLIYEAREALPDPDEVGDLREATVRRSAGGWSVQADKSTGTRGAPLYATTLNGVRLVIVVDDAGSLSVSRLGP